MYVYYLSTRERCSEHTPAEPYRAPFSRIARVPHSLQLMSQSREDICGEFGTTVRSATVTFVPPTVEVGTSTNLETALEGARRVFGNNGSSNTEGRVPLLLRFRPWMPRPRCDQSWRSGDALSLQSTPLWTCVPHSPKPHTCGFQLDI